MAIPAQKLSVLGKGEGKKEEENVFYILPRWGAFFAEMGAKEEERGTIAWP